MLAQLLIQFQKPIITENPLQNATNQLSNDTFEAQLSNTTIERMIRSIPSNNENTLNRDSENSAIKERFVAPDYTSNGKAELYYYLNQLLNQKMSIHFLSL